MITFDSKISIMSQAVKIIDLFAGPGGLGEGFSAFLDRNGNRHFRIAASIERESSAHRTLLLRAFYRQFNTGEAPKEYYDFLAGKHGKDPEQSLYQIAKYSAHVSKARCEARQLELGKDNRAINAVIEDALGPKPAPWVLVGGPPCQAYSLAGRVRNMGVKDYKPEEDSRQFLYKEYLKVIARFQPAVFVMENVKGLLSATLDGERIFRKILEDLEFPYRAVNAGENRTRYHLISLVPNAFSGSLFGNTIDPKSYVVRAERYGIPQARHRIILLGIRDDLIKSLNVHSLANEPAPSISDVIDDLPRLRSGLSKERDSLEEWIAAIQKNSSKTLSGVKSAGLSNVAEQIDRAIAQIEKSGLERGTNWSSATTTLNLRLPRKLRQWYLDESGWRGVCNHETRGHIREDLQRYLFCACYGAVNTEGSKQSPSSEKFPAILAPNHANWKTGHFADRYRVQVANRHATTITSHISKDGHYFIHYDPTQCRSLTVREGARVQTFPDNYFFVGNRTEQYVQVGNAVPPYLAHQIAFIVSDILR